MSECPPRYWRVEQLLDMYDRGTIDGRRFLEEMRLLELEPMDHRITRGVSWDGIPYTRYTR